MDPKPLPAGRHRLKLMCTCGRLVPAEEQRGGWWSQRPCPDCGGRQRRWWRRRVTLWERLEAWWELRQWKKRKSESTKREWGHVISIDYGHKSSATAVGIYAISPAGVIYRVGERTIRRNEMVGAKLISHLWRTVFLVCAVLLGWVAGAELVHHSWSALFTFAMAMLCLFCRWHAGKYLV